MRAALTALVASLLITGCEGPGEAPGNAVENAGAPVDLAPANSAAPPSEGAPGQGSWVLTSESLGPLRIGMLLQEITAAAGPDSDPAATGGAEPKACDQFRPERAPEHVLVMVENGRLTRISLIRDAAVKTDRGLATGDPARAVREAYGADLTREPHKYVAAPAAYLTHWSKGGDGSRTYVDDPEARGIRYEIGPDERVQAIHAGGPSIQYVEGCS